MSDWCVDCMVHSQNDIACACFVYRSLLDVQPGPDIYNSRAKSSDEGKATYPRRRGAGPATLCCWPFAPNLGCPVVLTLALLFLFLSYARTRGHLRARTFAVVTLAPPLYPAEVATLHPCRFLLRGSAEIRVKGAPAVRIVLVRPSRYPTTCYVYHGSTTTHCTVWLNNHSSSD